MIIYVYTNNDKTGQNDKWTFRYIDNKLINTHNAWNIPARDLDQALDKIYGYFTGTSYKIITLQQGVG